MDGKFPKISIVTPCAGMASTIETTIQSILGQGYPNLEYIVLDAGLDDTRKILEKYDSQISFWRSAPDDGQYESIAEGFEMATGSIYFWLNADDILLPGALFTVAEIFTSFPEVEWLSTLNPLVLDARGRVAGGYRLPGFSREAFLDGLYLAGETPYSDYIQQESTFFSASLWKRGGHALSSNGVGGDFALWAEFYKSADLVGLKNPLGAFRLRRGQRSDGPAYGESTKKVLTAIREEMGWSSPMLNRLLHSKLVETPGVRGLLLRSISYEGTFVREHDVSDPETIWIKERKRFLPCA
jgi:glycosyltransferase involved in cell wall biosynthesis